MFSMCNVSLWSNFTSTRRNEAHLFTPSVSPNQRLDTNAYCALVHSEISSFAIVDLSFVEQFQPIDQLAEHPLKLDIIIPFREIKDVVLHDLFHDPRRPRT